MTTHTPVRISLDSGTLPGGGVNHGFTVEMNGSEIHSSACDLATRAAAARAALQFCNRRMLYIGETQSAWLLAQIAG